MSQEIRSQRKCYYASAGYAESLWGKFGWIYEGRGSLRLTTDGIVVMMRPGALEIPFESIKGVALTRFSSWSKPFGLARLTVHYHDADGLRTIHLVPFESAFDPTWTTSEIVESWYQTLGQVEVLAGRIEPPSFEPAASPSFAKLGAFGATWTLMFVVFILTTFLLRR